MGLARGAPLVQAAGGERAHVNGALGIGRPVAQEHLLGDHVEPDAAHAGGRPGEVVVDHVLAEAKRLKHLSAAVALDRGDAHLGHHLHHALGGGLHEVRAGLGVVDAGEVTLTDHVVDRLEGDIRVHRAAAVADQQGEVVHLARLAGLEDQRNPRAQALADEVVVEPGHREQRGDRREVLCHAAVAEDEDVDLLLFDHPAGHDGELLHRLGEALLPAGNAEKDRQHPGLEAGKVGAADLAELLVGEHGPLQLDAAAGAGLGLEQVALGAKARLGGSDDLLADRVDRRVGDLGEQLLEVIVEQPRLVGEHREGGVVAHRADRLHAVLGHRQEEDALILEGVPEGDLALQERVVVRRLDLGGGGQVAQVDEVLVEPLAVRLGAADLTLDLLVLDDAALGGVDEEHPAGLEAALADDLVGRDVEDAGLGGHNDEAVLGDVEAGGAEAVAVEDGADLAAVGEGDRGGAVPRLHQAGVILVEGAALVVHRLVVRPRLGDHHHHRVREGAAGEDEQLERVVEHRRVGPVGVDDGKDLPDVLAEELAGEERLAGVHPVHIAAQRVDLAIVGEVPVRVRPLPAGERVGGEAGVDEREGRLHPRVLQLREILVDLVGR